MNRAVFLDRDGVINKDKGYIYKKEDVEFEEGIFDFLRFAQSRNYLLIIITNQSGISRGFYSIEQFKELTAWMKDIFRSEGIQIHDVRYSPYHPDYYHEEYKEYQYDRKPSPGMILKAVKEFDIDVAQSVLIGDKELDIETGANSGVQMKILYSKSVLESRADYIASDFNTIEKILMNWEGENG